MARIMDLAVWLGVWLFVANMAFAQETASDAKADADTEAQRAVEEAVQDAKQEVAEVKDDIQDLASDASQKVQELATETKEAVKDISRRVDTMERAQEASAGVLRPIYRLAERLSFPAFYWLAFAVMVTGVVSFALQLVLAKLVVLTKLGFSFTEILSDALGLAISLIGLVLTTQAATQNSTFTQSPTSVLSATAIGVILGFLFYVWGQRREVEAVEGRWARQQKSQAQGDKPKPT